MLLGVVLDRVCDYMLDGEWLGVVQVLGFTLPISVKSSDDGGDSDGDGDDDKRDREKRKRSKEKKEREKKKECVCVQLNQIFSIINIIFI